MTILIRVLITFFFIYSSVFITGCSSIPSSSLDNFKLGRNPSNTEQGDKPIDERAELLVTTFQVAIKAFISMEMNLARVMENENSVNRIKSKLAATEDLNEKESNSKVYFRELRIITEEEVGKQDLSQLNIERLKTDKYKALLFDALLGDFLVGNAFGAAAAKGAQELLRQTSKNPHLVAKLSGNDTLTIIKEGAQFFKNDVKSIIKYGKTMLDISRQRGLKVPSLKKAKARMAKDLSDPKEIALLTNEEDPNF